MSKEAQIFGYIVATVFTIGLGYALVWVSKNYPLSTLLMICGAIIVGGVGLGFLMDRKSGRR